MTFSLYFTSPTPQVFEHKPRAKLERTLTKGQEISCDARIWHPLTTIDCPLSMRFHKAMYPPLTCIGTEFTPEVSINFSRSTLCLLLTMLAMDGSKEFLDSCYSHPLHSAGSNDKSRGSTNGELVTFSQWLWFVVYWNGTTILHHDLRYTPIKVNLIFVIYCYFLLHDIQSHSLRISTPTVDSYHSIHSMT